MQRIHRSALAMGLVAIVLAVGAAVALASNVHFKKGSPTFADNGLTLTSSGDIVGLGTGDVTIDMTATGKPTATCTNPSGGNQPPGQNPAEVTTKGSSAIPASAVKNGNASYAVTTKPPKTPVPGAPDCPSDKWTETITDVAFKSATLTFSQGGSVVLTASCTFSPATTGGPVPSGNVSCTSS